MRISCALFFFVILLSANGLKFLRRKNQNKILQIQTQNGIVQGIEEKSGYGRIFYSFMGIPFAKPPIGDLRFRAPEPPNPWRGILDATQEASCCMGLVPEYVNAFNLSSDGSEDCLYLNVYTPKNPNIETFNPLPVYVFIYGGGFMIGCSNRVLYGPEHFMERDVILVTMNYRLGILGFMSTEDLECPGNWGIKDQLASLKWVNKNIKNFGGDNRKITLGGHSAGAASANILLLSPRASGLFQGIIMQSGTILCPWSNQTKSREIAFRTGLALGIETQNSKELVSELRKVDVKELTTKMIPVLLLELLVMIRGGFPFTPVVEPNHKDAVITNDSFDEMKKGNFPKIPVLAGVTEFEFGLFQGTVQVFYPYLVTLLNVTPGFAVKNIKSVSDRYIVGKKIQRYFTHKDSYELSNMRDLLEYLGEDFFNYPVQKTLSFISRKNPVYFYVFSYEGPASQKALGELIKLKERKIKGACHSEEIYYLFNGSVSSNPDKIDAKDTHVSRNMINIWSNFITYGNPSTPELENISWPTVTDDYFPYVSIGYNLKLIHESYNKKNYEFWENIYKTFSN